MTFDFVAGFNSSPAANEITSKSFGQTADYATATIAPAAEIPEIDGPVFAQLLAVLGAGWLAAASRRREQDAAAA